jgi:predicted DNA-binding transcriptional regulator AlpA
MAKNDRPQLPETGFVRLPVVLSVFPVCRSTWWAGVKSKKFPQPVKLSTRIVAWKVSDIRALIDSK